MRRADRTRQRRFELGRAFRRTMQAECAILPCGMSVGAGVLGRRGLLMQGALRLVEGANVCLRDVALLVLVDRSEMAGDRLVAGFRLIRCQMAVVRDVGLLEALIHRMMGVRRFGGRTGCGWLGMRGD